MRAWFKRNVADDDPHEALPTSALFIINGTLTDREGLRMIAHNLMLPSKTRRQTWN